MEHPSHRVNHDREIGDLLQQSRSFLKPFVAAIPGAV